ncbi:DNA-dependent metalloprotease SPRTN-like [Xenopus laevis]|uniref:DNA-dependent metalloprotease SPRTN-like n=1 Tax=Xenopus laevis TaxID=8355 RepID=A0A8J1MDZ7_XENLA|nr:DNA-dependent metalloprotease SPRTN-like [Xenopus laevis]
MKKSHQICSNEKVIPRWIQYQCSRQTLWVKGILLFQRMSGFALETSTGKMKIRLNKPLLDLRPKRTTVEILLHEMIHIHQFSSKSRDRSHGPTFHYHKRRINRLTGANIMAYPDFKDEYDLLKCHWWECNGPCGELVTRIMNRPPATKAHKRKCGGEFIKISESEDGPSNKRRKV